MHIQGRQSSGRAGGEVKELRAMETLKKNMLTSKIITEIIENHPKYYGCPNSCNRFA